MRSLLSRGKRPPKQAKPPICRICDKKVMHISNTGKCFSCGQKAMVNSIVSLKNKEGAVFEKWRKNLVDALQK